MDAIAREFSPRYERHGDDRVTIDVAGLERLFQRRSVLDTREGSARGQSERGWGPASREEVASALASGGGAARSIWNVIGDELRRDAADRGVRVHVAIAGTCTHARASPSSSAAKKPTRSRRLRSGFSNVSVICNILFWFATVGDLLF
ncbi:MAG: hypothetical protein DMG01_09490 [Acidobacteria bacterium]|nr:MAG: hypothetical protein DMG01_09490 [Acidobacteriota bacterium]